MLALLMGPILYFRDLGVEKYILAICSASAGMLAMFWQTYSLSNQTLRDLHDFIDFEKLKSSLEKK